LSFTIPENTNKAPVKNLAIKYGILMGDFRFGKIQQPLYECKMHPSIVLICAIKF